MPVPAHLDSVGAELWRQITSEFQWDDGATYQILEQACFARQRAERCRRFVDDQGEMLVVKGILRSHPLLRDEIANRALCARLLGRLGLDLEPLRSGPGRPSGGMGV